MNTLGETSTDQLDFVTLEGLLSYGEELAQRMAGDGIVLPSAPPPLPERPRRVEDAMDAVRAFVRHAQIGFPAAADYRAARAKLITDDCGGDEMLAHGGSFLGGERLSPSPTQARQGRPSAEPGCRCRTAATPS